MVLKPQPTALLDTLLEEARDGAAKKAICPICVEALCALPAEVGALTFNGNRVESALYHKSCVMGEDDKLLFRSYTGTAFSPISREQVNSFRLMPKLAHFKSWVAFVDWQQLGHLNVQVICTAVASLLPIDENQASNYVVSILAREDIDQETQLETEEVTAVLQELQKHVRRVVTKARRKMAPEVHRHSGLSELQRWFAHWDTGKKGELNASQLRAAIIATFHTALSNTADDLTKSAIVTAFFTTLGLRETSVVSRAYFLEKIAPQLLANLPVCINAGTSQPLDVKLPLHLKLRHMKTGAERPVYFPKAESVLVGDLREAAMRTFRVVLCNRTVKLFNMGQLLKDDTTPICTLRNVTDWATIMFLPGDRKPMCEIYKQQKVNLLQAADSSDDDTSDESCSEASEVSEPPSEVSQASVESEFTKQEAETVTRDKWGLPTVRPQAQVLSTR